MPPAANAMALRPTDWNPTITQNELEGAKSEVICGSSSNFLNLAGPCVLYSLTLSEFFSRFAAGASAKPKV
jgi:hypothetical protein